MKVKTKRSIKYTIFAIVGVLLLTFFASALFPFSNVMRDEENNSNTSSDSNNSDREYIEALEAQLHNMNSQITNLQGENAELEAKIAELGASVPSGDHVIEVDELPDEGVEGVTYKVKETKLTDIMMTMGASAPFSMLDFFEALGVERPKIFNVDSLDEVTEPLPYPLGFYYVKPESLLYIYTADEDGNNVGWSEVPEGTTDDGTTIYVLSTDYVYNVWRSDEFSDVIMVGGGIANSFADIAKANGMTYSFNTIPTKTTEDISVSDIDNEIFHWYYIEDENDIFMYCDLDGTGANDWVSASVVFGVTYKGVVADIREATEDGYYALGPVAPYWKKYFIPMGEMSAAANGTYDVSEVSKFNVAIPEYAGRVSITTEDDSTGDDTASNTLKGYWRLNDVIDFSGFTGTITQHFDYNIQETNNGIWIGADIVFDVDDQSIILREYDDGTNSSSVIYTAANGWSGRRNFLFRLATTTSSDFYQIFTANAENISNTVTMIACGDEIITVVSDGQQATVECADKYLNGDIVIIPVSQSVETHEIYGTYDLAETLTGGSASWLSDIPVIRYNGVDYYGFCFDSSEGFDGNDDFCLYTDADGNFDGYLYNAESGWVTSDHITIELLAELPDDGLANVLNVKGFFDTNTIKVD